MNQRYSSRLLTHFVGRGIPTDGAKYELFKSILKDGWLLSKAAQQVEISGRERLDGLRNYGFPIESVDRLNLNDVFIANVVCFADIPFSDLAIHTAKYGPFGIGFHKPYLIEHGASPVFYICGNAVDPPFEKLQKSRPGQSEASKYLSNSFRDGISRYIKMIQEDTQLSKEGNHTPTEAETNRMAAHNFIGAYVFSYMKFWNYEEDDAGDKNYYFEREWRIPTAVRFTLADVRRVIIPQNFSSKFRKDLPDFRGEVLFSSMEL